jgi:predicted acylesterase/phospholipase RssA
MMFFLRLGLSDKEKAKEFLFMRQVYGRSALLLSGGGGLGIYHMGVVKALLEVGMLPRVISGSSAGSIVGQLKFVSKQTLACFWSQVYRDRFEFAKIDENKK